MAEGHNAVAFSFTVTPEGVDVNLNHEALKAVWQSGVRSWKKRYARMRVSPRVITEYSGDETIVKCNCNTMYDMVELYLDI